MLYIPEFTLTENSMELIPDALKDLPYICNVTTLDQKFQRSFAWHWHEKIEIILVETGIMRISISDGELSLQAGDACFVNANVLHRIENDTEESINGICRFYTIKFDPVFLSGMYGNLLEQKYLHPIIGSRAITARKLDPGSASQNAMVLAIGDIFRINEEDAFEAEFQTRNRLSDFWCELIRETEELRREFKANNLMDEERVKAMMRFIQDHYTEKISLREIAETANIGERECGRCFMRCIGMSPFVYLNSYRIQMAAQQLVLTEDAITTISERCGFGSPAYFGKLFRKQMHYSPREYRKNAAPIIETSSR